MKFDLFHIIVFPRERMAWATFYTVSGPLVLPRGQHGCSVSNNPQLPTTLRLRGACLLQQGFHHRTRVGNQLKCIHRWVIRYIWYDFTVALFLYRSTLILCFTMIIWLRWALIGII